MWLFFYLFAVSIQLHSRHIYTQAILFTWPYRRLFNVQILDLLQAPLSMLTEAEKAVRFSPWKTCVVCSKQFKAKRFDARLCSCTCRSRLYRAKLKQNKVNQAEE